MDDRFPDGNGWCTILEKILQGLVIFTVLTSLTVLIIKDMGNPHRGFVRPSYNIYEYLLDEIKAE
jgi:hypothetical protein